MITIIGSGPAGSYLAYLLAKKGKDVTTLYIERLHISAIFGITSFLLIYLIFMGWKSLMWN